MATKTTDKEAVFERHLKDAVVNNLALGKSESEVRRMVERILNDQRHLDEDG
jgi:hypothetical protein